MFVRFIRKDSIAKQFIVGILIFSSCVTFLLTATQLFFDYSRDLGLLEDKLELIEAGYQQSISESLWVVDHELLKTQMKGILKIPDIRYVEIRKEEEQLFKFGQVKLNNIISRRFQLSYMYRERNIDLGTCYVNADLDRVYSRLIDKAVIILLSQGAKTFLVSAFIFFLFYNLIGKHLIQIADYTRKLNLKEDRLLVLKRPKGEKNAKDELHLVTEAINTTMQSLRRSYKKLHLANDSLKKEIDERKLAEDRLQDGNLLLNTIIEGTTDAIFLKNIKGEYVLANQACLEAMGKPEYEVIGRNDRALFPPESAEAINEVDSNVIRSGRACVQEEKLETAYGKTYWLSNKNPHRDNEGNIIGLIGISRNITEIKQFEKAKNQLEKRLLQAQKMEAIGTLAGGIAHDFNNILFPLLGYAEMLQEDLPEASPEQERITEVLQAGLRAKELVRQILTFSRQRARKLKPVKIQPILKEALKLLRSTIPRTIDIRTEIDPGCGMVVADPTQIHQVIMNLATNAYHAMQESGGQLIIFLGQTRIGPGPAATDELPPGRYALLKVIDTGTGIEKETMDKIFDPYFTTKSQGKGTGLGLSVVQGIVKNCKGDIHIYSEPDKGTEVHLYLPVMETGENDPTAGTNKVMPGGSERILLVDDEEAIVKMESLMLERLGYRVTCRTGSLEALEVFRADPYRFDLLITDMTMPDMTGIRLIKKIRGLRADIPVIICTGYSDLIDKEKSAELGIQGYLVKPVMKSDLTPTVRNVLNAALG